MMRKILLFPFNGNSREALATILELNKRSPFFEPVGFFDDNANLKGKNYLGVPVLGGRDCLTNYPQAMVLALPGSPTSYAKRKELIEALGISVDRFATVIHPTASIGEGCRVGVNVWLGPGVVATTGVTVGNHVAILPNTVLSHDVVVEDYVLIGSNVSASGGVVMQEGCYVGSGTRIIGEANVGRKALVGLGSVVTKSIAAGAVVAGCPAKPLR